ncbi:MULTISPECIES: endonuclease/exonuclease/phosphatase family protein [Haloarcula]|uniref:endonuclease/exonuclease/phosphatase family protein n=1 Tax=Haloarcula TaxID=2237 RepID=UPI0023E8C9AB|nr:endonuclease/exonuclease/phosphatase family protein [Halomicroarcula sp. SHR3]
MGRRRARYGRTERRAHRRRLPARPVQRSGDGHLLALGDPRDGKLRRLGRQASAGCDLGATARAGRGPPAGRTEHPSGPRRGRARREGIELALSRLAELVDDAAVVLCGDFNCVVGGPAHDAASGYDLGGGRRLRDSRRLAPTRHGPTTTRTDFEDLLPEMGIDHVFVSDDAAVTGWAAVTDRDDAHYASDHLPVVVDCEF